MSIKRFWALILSVLMLVLVLASCNGNGGDPNNSSSDPDESKPDVTVTVSFKVKDLEGNVVYDIPNYTYIGETPTPIAIIEDYFYMEGEEEAVIYDDVQGTIVIVSIGSLSKEEVAETNTEGEVISEYSTYWWWSLNNKKVENESISGYTVKNGDLIEFYLIKQV